MRPIDADVLKVLMMADSLQMMLFGKKYELSDAMKTVNNAPTIDAVPIVRCKDCKHGKEDEDGTIECTFWDFMDHTHHNDPEGFCYRAEPKETE